MNLTALAAAFSCPHCGGGFEDRPPRTLVCPAGHAFDVARQGYVNLVPAAAKKTKDPGYNPELIKARHQFFATGGYEPVAEAMADAVVERLETGAGRVLDAGCGEGYYLRTLRRRVPGLELVGTDLSRPGIRIAARLDASGAYAVANSFQLPIGDASVDVIISHFSPNPIEEFARVLRPGGSLIIGGPGADHLFALKAAIYDTPRRHDEAAHLVTDSRFNHLDRRTVRHRLPIGDVASLAALFAMTPFAYGAADAGRLLGSATGVFEVGLHVLFDHYRLIG